VACVLWLRLTFDLWPLTELRWRLPGPSLARVALLAGLLGRGEALGAQPRYAIRGWQTEDGLPENSVNAIVQNRDGYLWLGTYAGWPQDNGCEGKGWMMTSHGRVLRTS